VTHQMLPVHVVVLHVNVVMILPPPHSSRRARPMLSAACAPTSMLLPVQTVPEGLVIDTVGSVVSVLPVEVPVDVEPVDVEPVDVEPVDVEPVDVEPVDVEVEVDVAPDEKVGPTSLMIVTGAETVRLPAASMATALTT
jgi:hypothetical protein